jgi:lactate dehydrogenase-like 2-hydroxyacid dehydrogenase
VTAGIGSDHVDLNAANKTNGGITVAEVTGSNVVSVAEHVVMTILTLVRNFVPAHEQIERGDWNVAEVAKNEYDLENKVVGTVAVGRIGERVLRRLKAFDCKELLYFDYQPLSAEKEKEIGCRRVESLEEMLAQCDVVTINCPLHEKTRGLFNKELISKMKKGESNDAFPLATHKNCMANMTGTRLLARQYRPRRHRRQRRRRRRPQVWPPPRLRRRRVVPAASTEGPPSPHG